MSKRDGGPAFPRAFSWGESPSGITDGDRAGMFPEQDGMTLRDYFAGQALAGSSLGLSGMDRGEIAELMYDLADAMLAERAK